MCMDSLTLVVCVRLCVREGEGEREKREERREEWRKAGGWRGEKRGGGTRRRESTFVLLRFDVFGYLGNPCVCRTFIDCAVFLKCGDIMGAPWRPCWV